LQGIRIFQRIPRCLCAAAMHGTGGFEAYGHFARPSADVNHACYGCQLEVTRVCFVRQRATRQQQQLHRQVVACQCVVPCILRCCGSHRPRQAGCGLCTLQRHEEQASSLLCVLLSGLKFVLHSQLIKAIAKLHCIVASLFIQFWCCRFSVLHCTSQKLVQRRAWKRVRARSGSCKWGVLRAALVGPGSGCGRPAT
jgi:hypothetical protein